jgi:GMP synthase-like glutamine amidotransferase
MPWVVVQHVPWEGPGLIATEALARGFAVEHVHAYRGDRLPPASELGGLVLMGGPMSANDDSRYSFLHDELGLIRDCLRQEVPVLGVCLGAQLLARAFGARVMRGEEPEVGIGDVELPAAAAQDPVFAGLPSRLPVFHWHEETFELPSGAQLLASSAVYRNQAFRVGRFTYGLQFHVELDRELADAMAPHLPAGMTLADSDLERLRVSGERLVSRLFVHMHRRGRSS